MLCQARGCGLRGEVGLIGCCDHCGRTQSDRTTIPTCGAISASACSFLLSSPAPRGPYDSSVIPAIRHLCIYKNRTAPLNDSSWMYDRNKPAHIHLVGDFGGDWGVYWGTCEAEPNSETQRWDRNPSSNTSQHGAAPATRWLPPIHSDRTSTHSSRCIARSTDFLSPLCIHKSQFF